MKFGVPVGNFGAYAPDPRSDSGDEGAFPGVQGCLRIAERAEELGFDSVWVNDHVVIPAETRSRYPYNETGASPFHWRQHIYDPLVVMAALAARTQRVRLGTSVLVVPYRNPVLLAKMLATIDCLSRGRVVLGIGVGWMEEEFEALGIGEHYPVRGRVTDEWVRICIQLWTQEGPSSFEGRFYRFHDIGAFPKPVQRPHIPIWVGGKSEIAARRVARYGSGYHSIGSSPQQLATELALVRAEMEKRGRDFGELEVSMLGGNIRGSSKEELIERLGEYERVGLHTLVGVPSLTQPRPGAPHERLERQLENLQYFAGEIMPALR
jgi:probable F420-dependent oxidoreductase